jgi:hypothetical protein
MVLYGFGKVTDGGRQHEVLKFWDTAQGRPETCKRWMFADAVSKTDISKVGITEWAIISLKKRYQAAEHGAAADSPTPEIQAYRTAEEAKPGSSRRSQRRRPPRVGNGGRPPRGVTVRWDDESVVQITPDKLEFLSRPRPAAAAADWVPQKDDIVELIYTGADGFGTEGEEMLGKVLVGKVRRQRGVRVRWADGREVGYDKKRLRLVLRVESGPARAEEEDVGHDE